jgi:hypothetical protein
METIQWVTLKFGPGHCMDGVLPVSHMHWYDLSRASVTCIRVLQLRLVAQWVEDFCNQGIEQNAENKDRIHM